MLSLSLSTVDLCRRRRGLDASLVLGLGPAPEPALAAERALVARERVLLVTHDADKLPHAARAVDGGARGVLGCVALDVDGAVRVGQRRGVELEVSGLEGEEGVVAADADVLARVELGAALADEDLAGEDVLV